MNMKTSKEHLEILAGHVFDNDKLVTYKWLSKELCVHVNIAKQILWDFHQKYQNNNIECTYLLIGHLKERGMRVEVVREFNLSEAKEKFSKIISEHVYSVHKPIADLELLATSGSGDTNYSAIKCDACKERTDEEMQLLRWGTTAKKVTMENVTNLKSTNSTNLSKTEKNPMTTKRNGFNNLFNMAEKSKSSEKLKSSFQESDRDSMKKEKNIVEKNKNFVQEDKDFSKDAVEKIRNLTEKNKNSLANSTTKKVSPQNNSKKGSLDNFFGKLPSPSKSAEVISSEKKNDNAKKEFTQGKLIKEKNSHGKKRNRSKERNEVAKKRKRIVIQNDSSDSEIHSDIEMEESIPEMEPETPIRAKSPSPPKVKHENGKRKVLKLINRTYKEGEYIVTKKEHVYVSCSEDEEKEETRRKEQKKTEAKTEKVKKKQSTLTNFFKKC